MAGGNSHAARSARAKLQWRDRFGRFMEMGRGIKFKFRTPKGEVVSGNGVFVGVTDDANVGQVYVSKDPSGLPDGFYDIKSANAQEILGSLDPAVLDKQGIKVGFDAQGNPVGDRLDSDIPNAADIPYSKAPIGWKVGGPGWVSDDQEFKVAPALYPYQKKTGNTLVLFRNDKSVSGFKTWAGALTQVNKMDAETPDANAAPETAVPDANAPATPGAPATPDATATPDAASTPDANGLTLDLTTGGLAKEGFIVDTTKDNTQVIPAKQFRADTLAKYIVAHQEELGKGGKRVSIIRDDTNVTLDIVDQVPDQETANRLAVERHLDTVYDIANSTPINAGDNQNAQDPNAAPDAQQPAGDDTGAGQPVDGSNPQEQPAPVTDGQQPADADARAGEQPAADPNASPNAPAVDENDGGWGTSPITKAPAAPQEAAPAEPTPDAAPAAPHIVTPADPDSFTQRLYDNANTNTIDHPDFYDLMVKGDPKADIIRLEDALGRAPLPAEIADFQHIKEWLQPAGGSRVSAESRATINRLIDESPVTDATLYRGVSANSAFNGARDAGSEAEVANLKPGDTYNKDSRAWTSNPEVVQHYAEGAGSTIFRMSGPKKALNLSGINKTEGEFAVKGPYKVTAVSTDASGHRFIDLEAILPDAPETAPAANAPEVANAPAAADDLPDDPAALKRMATRLEARAVALQDGPAAQAIADSLTQIYAKLDGKPAAPKPEMSDKDKKAFQDHKDNTIGRDAMPDVVKAKNARLDEGLLDPDKQEALAKAKSATPEPEAESEDDADAPDYRGAHVAPGNDGYSGRLDNVVGIYPADIYEGTIQERARLYGAGEQDDEKVLALMDSLRNNPDQMVTVYRAAPNGAVLNPGDWVTPSKAYAEQHLASEEAGTWEIIEAQVPAKHLYTEANSLMEWGYDPNEGTPGDATPTDEDAPEAPVEVAAPAAELPTDLPAAPTQSDHDKRIRAAEALVTRRHNALEAVEQEYGAHDIPINSPYKPEQLRRRAKLKEARDQLAQARKDALATPEPAAAEAPEAAPSTKTVATVERVKPTMANLKKLVAENKFPDTNMGAFTRDKRFASGYVQKYDELGLARAEDGTILGVTGYMINNGRFQKSVHVTDVGSLDKSNPGVGTALMIDAAKRAQALPDTHENGKDFPAELTVIGAVDSAKPFYAAMGGETSPTSSVVTWTKEDRDALAAGTPNDRRVAEAPAEPAAEEQWVTWEGVGGRKYLGKVLGDAKNPDNYRVQIHRPRRGEPEIVQVPKDKTTPRATPVLTTKALDDAPAGSRWGSEAGVTYTKNEDGTFSTSDGRTLGNAEALSSPIFNGQVWALPPRDDSTEAPEAPASREYQAFPGLAGTQKPLDLSPTHEPTNSAAVYEIEESQALPDDSPAEDNFPASKGAVDNVDGPEDVDPSTLNEQSTGINQASAPAADFDFGYQDKDEDYADEKFMPTPEQRNIVKAVFGKLNVAVQALAGSGKTSTLELIARRIKKNRPDERILYIAFNKSVQEEAAGRMPGNVESRTGDSLAWQGISKDITKKMNNLDALRLPKNIAAHFGIGNSKFGEEAFEAEDIAMDLDRAITAFTISDHDSIDSSHFEGLDLPFNDHTKAWADAMWADINNKNGVLKFRNDHATKIWALTKPDLSKHGSGVKTPASIIFFDEAQDINPVMAKVVRDQSIQKIYVGDGRQAIYGFRGAENELDNVEVDVTLPLTQSWRFGPEVAGIGNRFLSLIKSPLKIIGGGPKGEVVRPDTMSDPDAILTRSNAGAIDAILDQLDGGRIVGVSPKFKKDLQSLIKSVYWLQSPTGKKPRLHEDLAGYNTWDAIKRDVERKKATAKVEMLFNLVDRMGTSRIQRAVEGLRETDGKPQDKRDIKVVSYGVGDSGIFTQVEGKFGPVNVKYDITRPQGRNDSDSAVRLTLTNSFAIKDRLKEVGFRFDPATKGWWKEGSPETLARDLMDFTNNDAAPVDVIVTTAHKAKGLEWGRVKIGNDFRGPKVVVDDDGNSAIEWPEPEELRLAYVAVTRAQQALDPGSLAWVLDYTDTADEDPANPSRGLPNEDGSYDEPAAEATPAPETPVPAEPAQDSTPEVPNAPEPVSDPSAPASEPEGTGTPQTGPDPDPVEEPAPTPEPEVTPEAAPATDSGDQEIKDLERDIASAKRRLERAKANGDTKVINEAQEDLDWAEEDLKALQRIKKRRAARAGAPAPEPEPVEEVAPTPEPTPEPDPEPQGPVLNVDNVNSSTQNFIDGVGDRLGFIELESDGKYAAHYLPDGNVPRKAIFTSKEGAQTWLGDHIADYQGTDTNSITGKPVDPAAPQPVSFPDGPDHQASEAKKQHIREYLESKELPPGRKSEIQASLGKVDLVNGEADQIVKDLADQPNLPNTRSKPRDPAHRPDALTPMSPEILNVRPGDLVDPNLIIQDVQKNHPNHRVLANGDIVVASRDINGKTYDVIVRRTPEEQFFVYIRETDLNTGKSQASRIGHGNVHSAKALRSKLNAGKLFLLSPDADKRFGRKKNRELIPEGQDWVPAKTPGQQFLDGKDLPRTSKEFKDALDGILERLVEHGVGRELLDRMAADNTLPPEIIDLANEAVARNMAHRAAVNASPADARESHPSYDGTKVKVGDWADWTDHRLTQPKLDEFGRKIYQKNADGSFKLNASGKKIVVNEPNPNYGKVFRGQIVHLQWKDRGANGVYAYSDHVYWVSEEYNNLRGVKPSKQRDVTSPNLKLVDGPNAPKSAPFFKKKEEKAKVDKVVAAPEDFGVPAAQPGVEAISQPRPASDPAKLADVKRDRNGVPYVEAFGQNVPVPANEIELYKEALHLPPLNTTVQQLEVGDVLNRHVDGTSRLAKIVDSHVSDDGAQSITFAYFNDGDLTIKTTRIHGNPQVTAYRQPKDAAPALALKEDPKVGDLVRADDMPGNGVIEEVSSVVDGVGRHKIFVIRGEDGRRYYRRADFVEPAQAPIANATLDIPDPGQNQFIWDKQPATDTQRALIKVLRDEKKLSPASHKVVERALAKPELTRGEAQRLIEELDDYKKKPVKPATDKQKADAALKLIDGVAADLKRDPDPAVDGAQLADAAAKARQAQEDAVADDIRYDKYNVLRIRADQVKSTGTRPGFDIVNTTHVSDLRQGDVIPMGFGRGARFYQILAVDPNSHMAKVRLLIDPGAFHAEQDGTIHSLDMLSMLTIDRVFRPNANAPKGYIREKKPSPTGPGNALVIRENVKARAERMLDSFRRGYKVILAGVAEGIMHEKAQVLEGSDGDKMFLKSVREDRAFKATKEVLANRVALAIGISDIVVARLDNTTVLMDVVDGKLAAEREKDWKNIQNNFDQYPNARLIGLLDYLIQNNDRHAWNWFIDDNGQPVPIDHGEVGFNKSNRAPMFSWFAVKALGSAVGRVGDIMFTKAELQKYRSNMAQFRAEFEAEGRLEWYTTVIRQLDYLIKKL